MLDRLKKHAPRGTEKEQLRLYVPEAFFMRECRVAVRPKEEIIELFELVLEYYKDRKYVIKGDFRRNTEDQERSLISERTIRKWEDNKKHIELGCISDPEKTDMYLLKPDAREVRHCTSFNLHVFAPVMLLSSCMKPPLIFLSIHRPLRRETNGHAFVEPAASKGTIMSTKRASKVSIQVLLSTKPCRHLVISGGIKRWESSTAIGSTMVCEIPES